MKSKGVFQLLGTINELEYWLSIMRDHAQFLAMGLSPNETEYIRTAEFYRNYFRNMMDKVHDCPDWDEYRDNLAETLDDFIAFKKNIIKGILKCTLSINMTPSFINHMVNEAVEFHSFLTMPSLPAEPFPQAVNLAREHNIWLADAAGHAAFIAGMLDPTEALMVKEAQKFKKVFDGLFIKSIELREMLIRTELADGALKFLSMEAVEWIKKFIAFLAKLKELRTKCMPMAAGTLQPLIFDHMKREERYYLVKIQAMQELINC